MITNSYSEKKTYVGEKSYSSRIRKSYIDEVDRSGILKIKLEKHIDNDEDSFKAALKKSRYRAIKEFRVCHRELVILFEEMNNIEKNMNEDIIVIGKKHNTYKGSWDSIFQHFNLQLSKIFEYASDSLIGSFSKKVKRIDNFTICLFGRTKAGKSTTMEALTEGDGVTIGKGRQNTTQDVKEYRWRELLVIDTPGIDAMDNIDQLETMALSFADESDLVVFLLPHQIEEGDFDKFSRFYKQNKPILLLLNVKKEIGKKGSMEYKMFLKHSGDIFEKEKIDGYKQRINDFLFSSLQMDKDLIPIVPVHSASAFMATQESDAEMKKKLYECSNFNVLEDQLVKEIREYGELYRIKNPHDTVILFADKIVYEFRLFQEVLEEQKDVFEDNILKFSEVKASIINKKNSIIQNKIDSFFNSKKNSVGSLVNKLFEEKSEAKRKKIMADFMPESEIKSRVEGAQKEIKKIIDREIKDFFETFSEQISDISFESDKSAIFSRTNSKMSDIQDVEDAGNVLEGVGLVGGVITSIGIAIVVADIGILGATGTLFGVGAANIWNPVGWVLMGASIVAGILGVFFKDKHKKEVAAAKAKARNDITEKIMKAKNKINSASNSWVNKILKNIEDNHIGVMQEYVEYTDIYIGECDNLFSELKKVVEKSRRKKFREMVRCIQEDDKLKIPKVTETDDLIEIAVPNLATEKKKKTEKVLSRVEEKTIVIKGVVK